MNPTLEFLNGTSADGLVLFSLRVGGLVLTAPVFSTRTVPMMLRTALVVLLTWLIAPVAVPVGAEPVLTPVTAITETLIGMALGIGAAVFVGAAEVMGELLSISIGLSGASVLDPLTNQSAPLLGQLTSLFAVALLLSMDAHHVMLEALGASTRMVPVGGGVDVQAGLARLVATGSTLFVLGLRFAAPVVAVVLLANAALAILARVAPQLNVLAVAFPIQIGLGLFALASTLPLVGAFLRGWTGMYEGLVTHLLGAFAGAGGR